MARERGPSGQQIRQNLAAAVELVGRARREGLAANCCVSAVARALGAKEIDVSFLRDRQAEDRMQTGTILGKAGVVIGPGVTLLEVDPKKDARALGDLVRGLSPGVCGNHSELRKKFRPVGVLFDLSPQDGSIGHSLLIYQEDGLPMDLRRMAKRGRGKDRGRRKGELVRRHILVDSENERPVSLLTDENMAEGVALFQRGGYRVSLVALFVKKWGR